nr:hypothetical protein KitaXyl93_68050 [Kitasatospora sp. Xyl93]
MLSRLGLRDRTQAALYARDNGLIRPAHEAAVPGAEEIADVAGSPAPGGGQGRNCRR